MFSSNRKTPLGLVSIDQGRKDRNRGKFSRPTGRFWLLGASGVISSVLIYQFIAARQLSAAKSELLSKQHAVEATLGHDWYTLRDTVEKVVLDAVGPWEGDLVEPSAKHWDFASKPGIYLRLRLSDAQTIADIRSAGTMSLKDNFTGCLLRQATPPNPLAEGGETTPPWNLRQAYASTRILSDEWTSAVRASSDTLRLRVFEQQYEKAQREEIPLAVSIVKGALFFLLVVDEPVSGEGAARTTPLSEDELQLVAHPARIYLIRLSDRRELIRLRRSADASYALVGGAAVADEETASAMKRQVNNCALAQLVRQAL